MNKLDAVKSEYLVRTRRHLRDHQTELQQFEDLWAAGKLREAYLLVDQITRDRGLVQTQEFRRADEELYWMLR